MIGIGIFKGMLWYKQIYFRVSGILEVLGIMEKRGVWNGGYIDEISSSNLEDIDAHEICTDCGRKKLVGKDCPFAKSYRAKLDKLDFDKVYKKLLKVAEHFGCNKICFVVYEKPDVVCGERWVMKDWFADHGIQIEEFNT